MRMRLFAMAGLALLMSLAGGCAGCPLPPAPADVTLQPGQYIRFFYAAPDLKPEKLACALTPFGVGEAVGITVEDFVAIFQDELAQAWQANGLTAGGPESPCHLSGAVRRVEVSGERLRFIRGKISAQLTVSGAITQNGRVLFAFQDCLTLDSPVNPGPPAPMEKHLLLRQLCRAVAYRLLNQLLLHGAAAESG